MNWFGKIFGGIVGAMIAGPIGAIIGIWLGHLFDKGIVGHGLGTQTKAQQSFFNTTFLVMGYIAKADGRISQNEIQAARLIMKQLKLTPAQKQLAIQLFNQGKQPNFNIETVLESFRQNCPFHPGLMHTFLDIQLQAAYADGFIRGNVKHILQYIANFLGLGDINFDYFDSMMDQQAYYHYQQQHEQRQQHQQRQYRQYRQQEKYSLKTAYTLLGISPSDDFATIKKAYRRKMSQHHPDKLIAKGLPEEMIKLATQKTQKIRAAYEEIRRAKGVR